MRTLRDAGYVSLDLRWEPKQGSLPASERAKNDGIQHTIIIISPGVEEKNFTKRWLRVFVLREVVEDCWTETTASDAQYVDALCASYPVWRALHVSRFSYRHVRVLTSSSTNIFLYQDIQCREFQYQDIMLFNTDIFPCR
jgi:hypothetical protein